MAMVTDVMSTEYFQEVAAKHQRVLVYFWAPWSEPCTALNDVVSEVASAHPDLFCVKVEAEKVPEVSGHLQVTAVPTFVFLRSSQVVDRLEGFDPAGLFAKASSLVGQQDTKPAGEDLNTRLKKLVSSHPVMLFIKGTPDMPRCGFSRKVVEAFRHAGTPFSHFDILQDEEVRQGLKAFSNWPTYPQVYAGGELLGGCDIILELAKTNELKGEVQDALDKAGLQAAHEPEGGSTPDRIKALLASAPVMLFMKGSPEVPRCGFSTRVVDALNQDGIPFSHFDILSDADVRQGLKEYSDWPTYPQLYANSELVGGCDIIEELHRMGELKQTIESELKQG